MNQVKMPARDDPKAVSHEQKTRIRHLLQFRIIVENLLYIIGVPKKFADEQTLKSDRFCGLFGNPKRIVINHSPKEDCGGQVAVYCHYNSAAEVAMALKVSLTQTNFH
jgi:hypothetical protein